MSLTVKQGISGLEMSHNFNPPYPCGQPAQNLPSFPPSYIPEAWQELPPGSGQLQGEWDGFVPTTTDFDDFLSAGEGWQPAFLGATPSFLEGAQDTMSEQDRFAFSDMPDPSLNPISKYEYAHYWVLRSVADPLFEFDIRLLYFEYVLSSGFSS
jgi:hypothetical protein